MHIKVIILLKLIQAIFIEIISRRIISLVYEISNRHIINVLYYFSFLNDTTYFNIPVKLNIFLILLRQNFSIK